VRLPFVRRRVLAELEATRRAQLRDLSDQLNTACLELRLVSQQRDKAEADVLYWRTRAERFIDQVGISHAILSAPAMVEPAPAPDDRVGQVFSALGVQAINTTDTSRTAGPPAVNGVNPEAAQAALADFHRTAVK
jgi:hypothetical protein